jgi:arsenate reductase
MKLLSIPLFGTQSHILHHLLILFKRKLARIKKPYSILYTHNSRRSHLSQVWAQTAAAHFNVKMFYSGGMEAALFQWLPKH